LWQGNKSGLSVVVKNAKFKLPVCALTCLPLGLRVSLSVFLPLLKHFVEFLIFN